MEIYKIGYFSFNTARVTKGTDKITIQNSNANIQGKLPKNDFINNITTKIKSAKEISNVSFVPYTEDATNPSDLGNTGLAFKFNISFNDDMEERILYR